MVDRVSPGNSEGYSAQRIDLEARKVVARNEAAAQEAESSRVSDAELRKESQRAAEETREVRREPVREKVPEVRVPGAETDIVDTSRRTGRYVDVTV